MNKKMLVDKTYSKTPIGFEEKHFQHQQQFGAPAAMSSRGKRRKTGKAGGRKRKAGGGSSSSSSPAPNITTAKCEGHAASLLARVDDLRRSHPEFCDLRIRPSSGEGGEVAAHSLIMAATSPYVLSKIEAHCASVLSGP